MRVSLILLISVLAAFASNAQSVNYGSNNGKYVKLFGTELYFEEYGKGVPLLLFHGGAGSISNFNRVIPALAKQFRVIAPDTPGHGRSQQTDTLSYVLIAKYMSGLIDHLKLDSVYVMGWSDGGVTALQLAIDRPDKVKRLIAVGANLNQTAYNESGQRLVSSLSVETVARDWGTWPQEYTAFRNADWKEFIRDIAVMWRQKVYITDEAYKTIKARTMIVLGDRDLVSVEHALLMQRMLPKSSLFIVPNTGHFVFGQSAAPLMTEAAIGFFNRL